MHNNRGRWIACSAVLLVIAALFITLSQPRDPAFVRKLNGRLKSNDLEIHSPQGLSERVYIFKSDFKTVRSAMQQEFKEPEWKINSLDMTFKGEPNNYVAWRFQRGEDSYSVANYSVNGEIEVHYLRRPSWLEEKWIALRNWLGSR